MASSTLIRGRRVVDPVPVQRGSLLRDGKRSSSFSDLAAAWENVGEAKSALEAAEARIKEANAGINCNLEKEQDPMDLPLQEIFSETQRYGRVTRYELRPSSYSRAAPTAAPVTGEDRQSRRMLEFALNTEGHQFPRRTQGQPAVLSPPSRDNQSTLANGGITRDPYYAVQSYSGQIGNAVAPSYFSAANNQHGRAAVLPSSSISQNHNVPMVGSFSSFDDSLEVPRTSAARAEVRSSSSLGLKAAMSNKSDALARLKERIQQQKEQAFRHSPESVQETENSESRSPRPSSRRDEYHANGFTGHYRAGEDVPERAAISKRKVASAPAPPAYRGFSEMDSRTVVSASELKRKVKSKESDLHNGDVKSGKQRPQKPFQNGVRPKMKKGPPVVQRVLAPRRPTDVITTSSWRAGQQTVKRVLGSVKKKKSSPTGSRPQSSSSQDTDGSEMKGLNFQWKADNASRKGSDLESDDEKVSSQFDSDEGKEKLPTEINQKRDVFKHGRDLDIEPIKLSSEADTVKDMDIDSDAPDMKELRGSKTLSREAKNILSDLDLDSDDSDQQVKHSAPDSKPKQILIKKSPKKRKSVPQQEVVYPSQKVRHYDAEEVKKYMAKQIADRKKKLKEDRLMKQKAVEERKKKLEELYNKQKKNLQNNLARRDKNVMGETYSKGPSDMRSIIHPYSRPLHQDEGEYNSEDTGITESDKENLDIASFKGLPIYSSSRTKYRTTDERDRGSSASSAYEARRDSSGSLDRDSVAHEVDESHVPRVTSVSVVTRKADLRPSAYVGFPEDSLESDRGGARDDLQPRSSSPHEAVLGTGWAKPPSSPPRDDRIAALKQTAAQLKQRLESEARRLGIDLRAGDLESEDDGLRTTGPAAGHTVFNGPLPGVGNLHDQADLNKELEAMTSAATTIQAAYRGHSVRQGLNWKLPSGQTLRSTVRQARYQKPAATAGPAAAAAAADVSEPSQYSTAWETVITNEDKSISEAPTLSRSSSSSKLSKSSRSAKVNKLSSTVGISVHESDKPRVVKGHSEVVKSSVPPWRSSGGDSLSVINIFARKNPHLKLPPVEDVGKESGTAETQSIFDETTPRKRAAGDTASLLEPLDELNQSGELLEQTLVAGSPDRSREHDYEDDFTGSQTVESGNSRHEASGKRTPSPDKDADETAVYSESFVSPGSSVSEHKTKSPVNHSLLSGPLSPTLSEGDLSPANDTVERSQTVSPVRRSPTEQREIPSSSHQSQPPTRLPPSVFYPGSEDGSRISPGSLDQRLTAELNRLEYMEESVRQLTDVERTRSVALAQQETVSLAQILKSRQLTHAREMENLRAKAREEALESAKQLEQARRAAANAAAEAAETISRVRLETAASISESADRLLKVQTEAARTTAESAKQVEEARSSAARTLLEVAQQQVTDTRGVAADAASAAAEAAVKSTMARYYEQQEQIYKERNALRNRYRDDSGDDHDRTRDSYSRYTHSEPTDSYSRTRSTRSVTEALDRSGKGPGTGSYTSDDFEYTRGSRKDKTESVHTASNFSTNHSERQGRSRTTPTPSVPATHSRHDSSVGEETGSVPEEMEYSVADSVVSDIALDEAEDQSLIEALTGDTNKKSNGRRETSLADEEYTLNFEESVMSSHTATDDEIDYRMILPSESHRRRSLGKTGRSGSSVGSDPGTVSYSSDDNHDPQDLRIEKALDEISAAPFSAEDSFSQFTSEMVRLMKEEEVRAKHQEGLLRLREKALKEKTRAEMAWLEFQKQRHRDKGADDVMPSIRKRQRGVLMRLQAEQAEIKRLKAANRAASYERRLLLMQQEEIARLRKSTKKIRQTVTAERTEQGNDEDEVKPAARIEQEHPKSEADSTEVQEDLEGQAAEQSSRSRSVISEDIKTESPTGTASVAEELPGYQSSARTQSFPSYGSRESGTRERKRSLSEGESDEGSAAEGQHSAAKGSPSASDSTVMQKLKKLRSQSSERYLTQREQKLMKRRKEAESLLENKKKLLEWKRRLDKEENLVRNLLNEALSLERTKARTTSITSEEDEQKDRSGRVSGSLSVSRTPSSKVSEKDRSTQRTESISESIKPESPGHQLSASESSVPEDITVSARDKSHDVSRDTEKSHDSSIPELEMKTRSQGSSIPEEIPEEYVNDTFESIDSTTTPSHSTPVRNDLSIKRDPSPTVSRASSKDDGSKSEEETSMTETSDHSDIESRVRRLKDQLELRKREAKRLYNERKRQRKAMLRAQEASLRKELQAVEMVISRTKAELNRPHLDSTRLDSATAEHRPTPTKADSSDSASLREVRYHLSRTSDISGGRKVTPTDKETLSFKSGSARCEGPSVVNVEETVSSASSLRDGGSSPVKSRDSFVSETKMDESPEKEKSLVGSEVETDRKTDNNLSERSRSSDGSLPPGLRKASHSELERKSSISERSDSKEDIKEEVRTAEDVSLDERSESRTQPKASLHVKSTEERSQSELESLSGSPRESSESARGRSVMERRDSDVHTEEEVKSVQDSSVSERSEIGSQSKVSVPETSFRDDVRRSAPDVTDGLEESRASRSGRSSRTSEQKLGISETSEASRVSEKPKIEYSVSFESVSSDVDEKEKSETDISEQISAEEDSKESEIFEAVDSGKDAHEPEKTAQETKHEKEEAKEKEKTQSESEISEEIVSVGKDDSEIEDHLSEADDALSANERERIESYPHGEKDLLKPPEVDDQLPSYSADFEPSVEDEKEDEEKSESPTPRASYAPDFQDAEMEGVEEREKSEGMEGRREPSIGEQQATEGRYSAGKSEEVGERSSSEQLKDKSREKTPVNEQATDDESIAEEISEIGGDLEEYSDQEGSHAEKRERDRLASSQQENEEHVSSEDKISRRDQLLPSVLSTTDTTQEKRSSEEKAERIADDLSALLLNESLNCVTVMFQSRRKSAEVLPEAVASSAGRSREDGTKATFTGVKETVLTKEAEPAISEPGDEISEHVGYSGGEESVSGLGSKTEGQKHEVISGQTEQLQKDWLTKQQSREAQGNAIVLKFSQALLKEAAAQMIAIMRSRQDKLSTILTQPTAAPSSVPEEARRVEPHSSDSSDEESLLSSPPSNRFMAVQRFPDGMPKYAEETPSPPGSPTKLEVQTIDEKELTEKLDQLRRLHEHLDNAREIRHDEEDNRLEFNVVSNSIIEFPSQDEEEEDEGFRRSRGASFLFSVPHRVDEVASVVTSSLSVLFDRKRRGLPIDKVTPPSEIIGDSKPGDDLEANSKRVYRRLVFDLSASVFKELLMEETPSHRPSWMKTKRRRKQRFHRTLEPLVDERDFRPVVEQQVLNLIGLGEARPSLETVRRKTPLKAGKKDLVDVILIQELREDEPLWVDYDDDELAVKFQVADAIFESLLSETVMVMNAVQLRREARVDVLHS